MAQEAICVYACVCVCILCVCISVCVLCVHVCVLCMCVMYMCVCVHVCMCVHVYVYVYVWGIVLRFLQCLTPLRSICEFRLSVGLCVHNTECNTNLQ